MTQPRLTITGHTRGIGYHVANLFASKGWEISGWSRTNDRGLPDALEKPQDVERMFDFLEDADKSEVTILNANLGFFNPRLFLQLYNRYNGQTVTFNGQPVPKIIIVVGSNVTDITRNQTDIYQIQKGALEMAVRQVQQLQGSSVHKPYVGLIKPGLVDTNAVRSILGKKMQPSTIANLIWHMVETKRLHDYCIYEMTVMPNE